MWEPDALAWTLIEDFPNELPSLDELPDLPRFEPRDLMELVKLETQWSEALWGADDWLDDPLLTDTVSSAIQESPLATKPVARWKPRHWSNWAERICSGLLESPSLSRPAINHAQSTLAFGTENVINAQKANVVVLAASSDLSEIGRVRVNGPVTALSWIESGALAFACGTNGAFGLIRYSDVEKAALEPVYASSFHGDQVRDMASAKNWILSAADSNLFMFNAEVLSTTVGEKHCWRSELDTQLSSVAFHPLHESVVSATTDWGDVLCCDLRSNNTFLQTVHPRGMSLLDHCWINEHQVIAAYGDGVLVKVDLRSQHGPVLSTPRDQHLWALDSVEVLPDGRVGAFGDNGFSVYECATMQPVAAFDPALTCESSLLGHGGCASSSQLFVTGADGSVFSFDLAEEAAQ